MHDGMAVIRSLVNQLALYFSISEKFVKMLRAFDMLLVESA